jgi:hypothetical protein
VALETLKPGSLVEATVMHVLVNGLYVHFLKGIEGTVFVDHLAKPLEEYGPKQTLALRIILVDLANKAVNLSELPHLVGYSPFRVPKLPAAVGAQVESAVVIGEAYGGSYSLTTAKAPFFKMFLHVLAIVSP